MLQNFDVFTDIPSDLTFSMPQHFCEFLPARLNVAWAESVMNLPSNLWSISSFEGSFSDGDCMLDPFSVMDLLATLQRCIGLLLLCRTSNWCNGHVAVVTAGVTWCCNERLESPGKMEEVIRKRVPAEITRLKHESWISMLVLTSFIWWTNTARLLPSDTLWSW